MPQRAIEVRPLAGALGAEITGVSLNRPLADEEFRALHRAFLENGVIVLREQDLTPDQQLAFARRFGPVVENKFFPRVEGYPEVARVLKEEGDTRNVGGAWHSDHSYDEAPALGSLLYALETPESGGDTLFAGMSRAFEALSDGMKAMLRDLRAIHSAAHVFGPGAEAGERSGFRLSEAAYGEVAHPVVRTHPETGAEGLFVNPVFTLRFEGMTAEESWPLLAFLYGHATRPEFTCRLRWAPGSLALWDNRAVMHLAVNDYHGRRRLMHRVTIAGDRPY